MSIIKGTLSPYKPHNGEPHYKKEIKQLSDFVKKDKQLKHFADQLNLVTKGKYPEPGKHWVAETIISDLQKLTESVGRKKYLAEWVENKNTIFFIIRALVIKIIIRWCSIRTCNINKTSNIIWITYSTIISV